tara:strand:- start:13496 stop:13678 length:183 start_codon:yes stop_codon:yes gene_type:complete
MKRKLDYIIDVESIGISGTRDIYKLKEKVSILSIPFWITIYTSFDLDVVQNKFKEVKYGR